MTWWRLVADDQVRPLVIVFNGLQIHDAFDFERTLSGLDCHALFLRDYARLWYLGPLDNVVTGCAIQHNVQVIQNVIANVRVAHLCTLGVSMGGFAALLYGALLGAARVLAFDAQTFVDAPTRAALRDHRRWIAEMTAVQAQGDPRYLNLASFLATLPTLPAMTLVCGQKHNEHNWVPQGNLAPHLAHYSHLTIDEVHAMHLVLGLTHIVNVVWLPEAGHNSAHKLRELNKMDILHNALGVCARQDEP